GVAILFMGSCATPYGPKGVRGGYSEKQIDEFSYQVFFEGNQNSSKEQVRTNLMYRCCELTLQHGYRHFIILSDDSILHEEDQTGKADVSVSKGMSTMVNAQVDVKPTSSNIVGIFTIQMLAKPEARYASFMIDAQAFMDKNEGAIKRK
ncbi:MAG: hypothetical protein K9M55_08040, partial [Candidatus Marinimicrobia bacterium]|nr:hypothetical protein [Candidatus Neomarinimicrobiota bacterium]